jgi:hypothetical protein
MRIVIQRRKAQLYWTARGAWTPNPKEALVFLDEVRALDYAFFHDIDKATPAIVEETKRSRTTSARTASPIQATQCISIP